MNAIKRVISGDDMQASNVQRKKHSSVEDDDAIGMQIDEEESSANNRTPSGDHSPAVVENDMDTMEAANFHIASSFDTPRSSLSDVSAAQRMLMDEDDMDEAFGEPDDKKEGSSKPPAGSGAGLMVKTLHRSNPGEQAMRNLDTIAKMVDRTSDESSSVGKTGGSQTSSRDWGWFEDVHASEGALSTADSPGDRSRGGKQSKDTSSTANKRKTARTIVSSGLVPSQGSLHHETLQPIMPRDPETGES